MGCCGLLKGIFLTQGWNLCLLQLTYWQARSLPGVPPGKPMFSLETLSNPAETNPWRPASRVPHVLSAEYHSRPLSVCTCPSPATLHRGWSAQLNRARSVDRAVWRTVPSAGRILPQASSKQLVPSKPIVFLALFYIFLPILFSPSIAQGIWFFKKNFLMQCLISHWSSASFKKRHIMKSSPAHRSYCLVYWSHELLKSSNIN